MYVDRECNRIIQEEEYFKRTNKEKDSYTFMKLLIGILLLAVINISALQSEICCPTCCPTCGDIIEVEVSVTERKWPFPDTWFCRSCGYENYEGLNYCGFCGGAK